MMFPCDECGKTLQAYPCACGYSNQPDAGSTKSLAPVQSYQPLHEGHYITKEQFGLNLYEAIKLIGGIIGLDTQRAQAIHKGEGYKVQDLLTRRKELQKTLAGQLPQLTDDEMDQILQRYPWVTQC